MTSKIAAMAAKRLLGKEFEKYAGKKVGGDYDPLFEQRPNKRGKMKKCKKLVPAYIPEDDAIILAKVRKRAYQLDLALFNFMGLRFGWSSVVGLIPAVGDAVDLLMALGLFRTCCKVKDGLDHSIKIQMLMWIFIDFVVGLVPLLGDLLDASIKANAKNCRLLEEHLDQKYKPENQKVIERTKRQSDPHYKPAAPATVYEGFSDDEQSPHRTQRPSASQRTRESDVEMALPREDRPARRGSNSRR